MATEWKFELVAGPFKGATEGPVWDGKALPYLRRTASSAMTR
jgi:hypothetical protein